MDLVDLKAELLAALRASRAVLLTKVDGLSEYDLRRPLTPTGTNLLGLVKHLAGLEYGYLGVCFDRPPSAADTPSWFLADPSHENDLWATPDESSAYVVDTYRRAAAHADATVTALELDAVGSVPHWPAEQRRTTLGVLLVRMVGETAQHAGHADIVRELIDGRVAPGARPAGDDPGWQRYRAVVQAAADVFR